MSGPSAHAAKLCEASNPLSVTASFERSLAG